MTRGQKLRLARKQAGLSQVQLAEKIDVAQSVVSNLENGILDSWDTNGPLLEEALALPPGYFASERPNAPTNRAIDRPAQVSIPEYDVRLSAGGGHLIDTENVKDVWQFSRRYLVDELRLSPSSLAVVEVEGDSMEPTLRSGDRVLVDHSDRNPAKPGIYAIFDSNATVVKRLEKIPASDPPKVVLISDNPHHSRYEVPAELVNVIGRVVWFARRL